MKLPSTWAVHSANFKQNTPTEHNPYPHTRISQANRKENYPTHFGDS